MPSPGQLVLCSAALVASFASSAHAARCASIHAAKIALASQLPDCDDATITAATHTDASGRSLGVGDNTVCIGLTANECAAYFVAHPERGLIPNQRGTHDYVAHHVGVELGLQLPDGTRPMVYYRPAPGTVSSNPHFNSWIFYFYGGAGMCAQDVVQRERADGAGMSSLTVQGAECLGKIDYASQDETKPGTGFNRNRHVSFEGYGILGSRESNAVFANYNRVVITKTNDYYIGDVTKQDVDVGSGLRVDTMQLQGNAVVKAVFAYFSMPVDGGADLDAATHVLLVASSSGTNAVHRVDEWRQDILARAPGAFVALMMNSSGVTPDSFAFEEYDDAPCGSIYAGNCGATFDDPPHGEMPGLLTTGKLPRAVKFSHAAFLDYTRTYWDGTSDTQLAPGGDAHSLASVSASRDSVLDASCLAYETAADEWKCRSPIYLVFNHLRTPLFIAHSLRDSSNIQGVLKGVASRDASGDLPRWNKVAWDQAAVNPLGLSVLEPPMQTVARFQFASWVADRNDPNGAVGDSRFAGPIGVWASDDDMHEPEKHDRSYKCGNVTIGSAIDNSSPITLQEALVQWFIGRTQVVRIDGLGASQTILGPNDRCS